MTDEPAAAAAGAPDARIAVWDLPTRLFHWALVALFAVSWWSAEEQVDWLHLWSGYMLVCLLVFRLLWGFAGSSTARFASFVRGPEAILAYLRGGWRRPLVGHSPLGALSVLLLLLLLSAQVGLGLFVTDEDGETFGPLAHLVSVEASERLLELHEANFDVLLVLVGLHVAAVLFHQLVLGRKLIGPMISGRARLGPDLAPMRLARRWAALICLAVALVISGWMLAGAPLGG